MSLDSVITDCIAYGNGLTHIEETDWETMCEMEAFDHIYVGEGGTTRPPRYPPGIVPPMSGTFGMILYYEIRVSHGPWKVNK